MFQLLCDSFLQVCGKWENTANLPIWQFFVAPFNMHYDCKVFKLWGVYHMYVERFNTHNKQAQPWTLPWITLLENKSWQSGSRGCSLILCRMYLKWLDKPQKWVPHTKEGKTFISIYVHKHGFWGTVTTFTQPQTIRFLRGAL